MRVAVYARVSTGEQTVENQLRELRTYCTARGLTAIEYLDEGVSGAAETRKALDALMRDARRRKFELLVVWRLDRLGRNLRHLVMLIDELAAMGIGLASLGEGIDTTTPAGRSQLHVLASFAQFERERIAERVRVGMARAKAQGKHVGRPRPNVTDDQLRSVDALSLRDAAAHLGISKSFLHRWRLSQRASKPGLVSPQ
jgi:DNA invertase Pin-like site-specific DNA recombinase